MSRNILVGGTAGKYAVAEEDPEFPSAMMEAALAVASAGLPVFPCKATGSEAKKPHTLHGFKEASMDAGQIREWWHAHPDALIGMPTGTPSNIVVLDVDMDETKDKDGEKVLAALLAEHGETLPQTFMVQTPRGGRHIYFQHPGIKVPSRTDHPGTGLDVRGDGGYVIVPPSQTSVGAYTCIDGSEIAPMPEWLVPLMVGAKKKASTATPNPVTPKPQAPEMACSAAPMSERDVARLRDALSHIPADNRDTWVKVGFALKSYLGESGWVLFDEWSQTAPDSYEETENRSQWDSFKPEGGITIRTVFHLAKQNGWIDPRRAPGAQSKGYTPGSAAEAYLGADNSVPPPKSSEEAKASLLERLAARMYSPTVKPEEPAPRFSLGGVDICTPGNLTAIGGPPKAAKSAIVTAMIASTFADPSADCLGARSLNTHGHAVIHIDTEQCPYDHWAGVQRTIRRAKVDGAPEWLQSYCLTGFPTQEVRMALRLLMEEGHRRFGGVHSVFNDGVADLALDVNDPAEANSLVAELHGLAIEFNCPIIGIIHLNPGSESKTRGHLGSQLERKAETNLRLEKDAEGVTLVWADKNRRAPISKDNAPRFAWSDEVGMHASKQSLRQVKDEALKPTLRGLADRVFSDAQKAGLTHTALVKQYMVSTGVSETTAKTKIKEMVELGVVVKGLDKIYSLKK